MGSQKLNYKCFLMPYGQILHSPPAEGKPPIGKNEDYINKKITILFHYSKNKHTKNIRNKV